MDCIGNGILGFARVSIGLAAWLMATSASRTPAEDTKEKAVPALSLEALFHPDKKHDYDGKITTAHWIGWQEPEMSSVEVEADHTPILIVRRKETWMQVDLSSGDESPWPVAKRLQQQLAKLSGIDQEKAKATANRIAGRLKRAEQTVLAKIGNSLAIVSVNSPARWLTRDAASWKNATLDPTSRHVAYTREGDLFIRDIATGRTLRMTQDASDTLLDGILDWTYQEEIFGRGNYRAFWFSPAGNWLAMLRIDISRLQPYSITKASSDRGSGVTRRYSKAGDPIPQAELYVWDLRNIDSANVPPPRLIDRSTPQQERIITGVWWHKHSMKLMYCISDRLQTWRELRYVDEPFLQGRTNKTTGLLREESPAWVEPPAAPGFLADGSLVWRSALPTGRSRLFWIRADGVEMVPISPEDFDVRDFFVRADGSFAIVTGDANNGTVGKHAYRIDVARAKDRVPKLVPVTSDDGWHDVDISPDGLAIIDQHSSLTAPPSLSVHATIKDGFQAIPLDRSELSVPGDVIRPELLRIATKDDVSLPAILYRPPLASNNNRCPVVIETYGGPQAPVATNRWSGTRALYRELLARRGIATLVVDNRSSAGRGIADTWSIQGKVGEIELEDLLTSVDYLEKQPWVDAQRLAVRGWSFGGFLTLYAMTHSTAFKAGIAGGSVTDWREYDSFYTERYMGLPSDNPEGYRTSAPVNAAENIHGHVLLIHGEVDDNVHPSGTLRMAAALQNSGKDFDMMIYPGSAHAIHDPQQAWHLMRMTDRFLIRHLLAESTGAAEPTAAAEANDSAAEAAKLP